jgi:hypothetical protein
LNEWSAGGRGLSHSIEEGLFILNRVGRLAMKDSIITITNINLAIVERYDPRVETIFQESIESGKSE